MDAVLVAGDLPLDGDADADEETCALITSIDCPVYFVSGNHDSHEFLGLATRLGWSNLDGALVHLGDDQEIAIAGWACPALVPEVVGRFDVPRGRPGAGDGACPA